MACITLLSDFGLQDASVAVAKGILLQYSRLPIIDISHDIQPFNNKQAAYLLTSAYHTFPSGTCHLVLMDLFTGNTLGLILTEHNGQYLLSPDTEIIPLAARKTPERSWLCAGPGEVKNFHDWLHKAGTIISRLQESSAEQLQLPAYSFRHNAAQRAITNSIDGINCEVIHIDQYENVVLDITYDELKELLNGSAFRIQFIGPEEITELSNTYSDVRPGNKLCRFNSSGYLEICINKGKAASLFGLRIGGKHNNIKITFE